MLRTKKESSIGGLPAEVPNVRNIRMAIEVHTLLNTIWSDQTEPEGSRENVICRIYEKVFRSSGPQDTFTGRTNCEEGF